MFYTTWVQWEQRLAASGISLRHSVHLLVVGPAGGSLRERETRIFIGLMTKKNIAAATKTKEMRAFIKSPYMNLLSLIVKNRFEKSGTFIIAAMSGVRKSVTSAVTTVPNAAPITTPTAKSTTFPLSKNCLNSLSTLFLQV